VAASATEVQCVATLRRPKEGGTWSFLVLPKAASARLRSRGMVSVRGALNGRAFAASLHPDGAGGHWLKVPRALRVAAGAEPGDEVELQLAAVVVEPEPKVPAELRKALAAGPAPARTAWKSITPAARRDFVQWVVGAKQAATRAGRIEKAVDMLAKGKRRPCCFDRSGMYDKSLRCPIAAD
jgi:hypothetical protein